VFFSGVVDGSWVEVAEAAGAAGEAGVDGSGEIVGFSAVHDGAIDHLYVLPAWQGRGIGNALLHRAMAAHPEGLWLWVFEQNTGAQALYARAGFVTQFRTDGSGNEEQVPDVRMRWDGDRASLRRPGGAHR
jgi:putative acetyltransferase